MDKKYVDSEGKLWGGKWIILEDKLIFNPTEEQILAAGYTEFSEVEEEPTESVLRARALSRKLVAVHNYDQSDVVNSFTIDGRSMWLDAQTRQQLKISLDACKEAGRETVTKWYNGIEYTFPIEQWYQMLNTIEVYAADALNVTESHIATLKHLSTKDEIEAYDITSGYPEKVSF